MEESATGGAVVLPGSGIRKSLSAKHMRRYVDQLAGQHSDGELDTVSQMRSVVAGMIGKRPLYWHLVA